MKHGTETIMLGVLVLLCALITWNTREDYFPEGAEAAEQVVKNIGKTAGAGDLVLIIGSSQDEAFIAETQAGLEAKELEVFDVIQGSPREGRKALERASSESRTLNYVACVKSAANWPFIENLGSAFPEFESTRVVAPTSTRRSSFLNYDNFMNILDRTAEVGIIAIGMTLIIITAGIDLSVGSVVALSAVVSAWSIKFLERAMDLPSAPVWVVLLACVAALLAAGLVGAANGSLVTYVGVPPFIVTLSFMMVARGLAYILSDNRSISELPDSVRWLGGKAGTIPVTVFLAAILFAIAHFLMSRTSLGRYIYAVGGNREAARLSGVPIKSVLMFVYCVTGLLAGLVGLIFVSKLGAGKATYAEMMELNVIAAVVIGGTSLFGGEGRILGTLIGSLLISVIGNGMNLIGIESNGQKVVLGLVILGAAIIDTIGKRHRAGG